MWGVETGYKTLCVCVYDHLNSVGKKHTCYKCSMYTSMYAQEKMERSKQKWNDSLLEVRSWVIFVFLFISFCTLQNVLKCICNKILVWCFSK